LKLNYLAIVAHHSLNLHVCKTARKMKDQGVVGTIKIGKCCILLWRSVVISTSNGRVNNAIDMKVDLAVSLTVKKRKTTNT